MRETPCLPSECVITPPRAGLQRILLFRFSASFGEERVMLRRQVSACATGLGAVHLMRRQMLDLAAEVCNLHQVRPGRRGSPFPQSAWHRVT